MKLLAKKTYKKVNGFTIIEMVIVILLTAIMAAIAIPQFIDYRKEAKNAKSNLIWESFEQVLPMNMHNNFFVVDLQLENGPMQIAFKITILQAVAIVP